MKKILKVLSLFAFVTLIAFTLVTCDNSGGGGRGSGGNNNSNGSPAASTPNIPSTPKTAPSTPAMTFVKNIKIGWNLGNTLDANPSPNNPPNSGLSPDQLEKQWGNPATTQANINALKNAGFNAIRIPVSWTKAASGSPGYTIRADFMNRVKQIVDYAVAADMYIILNTHHDEDVFKFENATAAAGRTAFRAIWQQVANTFQSYGEKLIFEGLNEPRTPGSSAEWNGGTAAERTNLNNYYQDFVDVVRASGGNNASIRYLLINPYGASGNSAAISGLTLPTDSANRLIVSIHSYSPYNFALNTNSTFNTWNRQDSSASDISDINAPIDLAYSTFVSKGIPVIIGEFGAMNKNNESDRARWADYYVRYAKYNNMPCIWWDNGVTAGSGELFGLLNRNNNTWVYSNLKDALIKASK